MQLKSQVFRLWEAFCTMCMMWGLRWEMTYHVRCIKSRRKRSGFLSEYLRTRVMTLTRSMTWITFVPANELAISRKTRTGILLLPSIMANVNSQLLLLTEHVLGLTLCTWKLSLSVWSQSTKCCLASPRPCQRPDLHRWGVNRVWIGWTTYVVYLNWWSLLGKRFVPVWSHCL